MSPNVIRAKLRRRPFRPLEFVLDNGERVRIGSPEILVADDMVAMIDPEGHGMIIAPEAVTMIRVAKGSNGKHGPREGR